MVRGRLGFPPNGNFTATTRLLEEVLLYGYRGAIAVSAERPDLGGAAFGAYSFSPPPSEWRPGRHGERRQRGPLWRSACPICPLTSSSC